uniref:Fibronectin type-III domain-containing protein n=1 Tax=Arion vulgaris TaxID=1028688 RepID=A0A0B7BH07_9EUPU
MAKETTFPSTFSNLVFGFLLIFTFHSQVLRAFQQYGDKCNQTTTCSSPNLTCSQNQTCACSPDFVTDYSNPGNIVCVKKSDYGEVCPAGDFNPCYSDTTCTPDVNGINRCLCDRSFYRTNFNTCSSMDELSPSKISATSTANTVTLTWTADKHGMDVTYTVISNQGQGQLVGSVTDTGATWSNLTSGRKYSFNITTTLPSDNYYPVKVMQVYKGDVWTEPAIPGPVMSVTLISGTPGAAYMYSITFQGSQGDVDHYLININNEIVDVTGTTSIFSTLKPGQNYSYSLTSYNGINNPSQVFTGTFKTNVTDPGVILNLTVQQDAIIARVLNISFFCPDAKAFPGNIQGYTIQKTLFDVQQVAEETPYRFVASHSACGASFSDSDVGEVFVERDYSFL